MSPAQPTAARTFRGRAEDAGLLRAAPTAPLPQNLVMKKALALHILCLQARKTYYCQTTPSIVQKLLSPAECGQDLRG